MNKDDMIREALKISEMLKKAVERYLFYEKMGKKEKAEAIAEFFNLTTEDLK